MKRIIAFVTLSILLLGLLMASSPEREADEKEKRSMETAHFIVEAYKDYLQSKRQAIEVLTKDLKFDVSKSLAYHVQKNCSVDSLVITNDRLGRWGYLKSVDLAYLKDVEAVFTIKSDESQQLAQALKELFIADKRELIEHTTKEITFRDTKGGYVVDTRFKKPTKSKIATRYHYRISVMENYLILEMKEVVSPNYVDSSEEMTLAVAEVN